MKQEPLPAALSPDDADDVDALRAANNETLGFMAMPVIRYYLKRGGGVGIRGDDGLRGYALYDVRRLYVRLIHLCVDHQHRGSGYAERLADAVVDAAKEARVAALKLTCRRDYARASAFWRRYGFIPLAEVDAKTDGARLMVWYLGIDGAAQRDIFTSVTSDEKAWVAIDAQIFYQLHAPESDEAAVAKGLQADFLADSLDLYITMEMFNEIDRAPSSQRKRWRDIAHAFPKLSHDASRMPEVERRLEHILPSGRPSERSDIRQLAMTATSNAATFLTRDGRLLRCATQIKDTISVDVLRPEELIVRLDQFTDSESYQPVPVSGSSLAWRRVRGDEVARLRSGSSLLGPHERKRHFEGRLEKALNYPKTWQTEALWSDGTLLALRSFRREGDRLVAGICRASHGRSQRLFTEYAAASLLHEAVNLGCLAVEVEPHCTAPEAREVLMRLGFVDIDGKFVRLCLAAVMSEADLRREAGSMFEGATLEDMARRCSPVALRDGRTECLMVPIKPGYARALFNTKRAAGDLFGADESVLLRWENVYFRKKNQHHMIQPPAQILWYESRGQGTVAVSHLNGVEVGQPKNVFRRNRALGTLGWREIQEMCGHSRVQEVQDVMALHFSHTHLFRSPVSFASLRDVYRQHGLGNPVVQSPSRVQRAAFLDIFRLGFPKQPAT